MLPIRFVPANTRIDFVRYRFVAFAVSIVLLLAGAVSLAIQGLNLGIDFKGGILVEVVAPESEEPDLGELRRAIGGLGLGEVELQNFGGPRNILIRIQQQEGGEAGQAKAVEAVRDELGGDYEYRRVEYVGPKVGDELLRDGILATLLSVAGIAIYVGFRFEWQFGISALLATFHDVALTAGLFSIFQLEFNLTAVAALLTIAGYSVNDTVVVFDRMREVLRKRKSADLRSIINESVNATLSRTVLTSGTTLLAIIPLLVWGGDTLFNFTVGMTLGILIGTFSSVFVAASLLLYLPPLARRTATEGGTPPPGAQPATDRQGAP